MKCLSWPPWANLGIGCYLQDTQFGEVKNARKTLVFSPSEAFRAPIIFDRGLDWPNLGPHDFSKKKYKGPMAPLSEKNLEITTKMHCQDLEKMRYLVFVKFLSWPSWANSETGFGLSTSKIPILGMSKMQGKPMVFSHSEAFQAPILFERGAGGPNLGPPDFSKEKYKGPMAPVVKKTGKLH